MCRFWLSYLIISNYKLRNCILSAWNSLPFAWSLIIHANTVINKLINRSEIFRLGKEIFILKKENSFTPKFIKITPRRN